ncbi:uncharacterized protein N7496_002170 [Penicillium cataractarum]|uniref:Subtelomeric hrmA-associated cluster protein AFUB-079030/YDR124W-like helical bundle domain-containing protein n=1 Tax=Penicillium cataractarum TaxID=2100454 RepID=A0A9W9SK93_9EURO|nr:uncharacterized protein N7496_002170 [Penicillium cataractarum]KAJ5379742.1 hypothetical protein N7496_002170 [Penicillium cataractarum]
MSRQNQSDELAYPHFALIYIDRDGNLRHEASPSIRNSREAILSPGVTNAFLQAVARSGETVPSHSLLEAGTTTPSPPQRVLGGQIPLRPLLNRAAESPETLGPDGHHRSAMGPRPTIQPAMWPRQQQQLLQQQQQQQPQPQTRQRPWNEEVSMRSNQKALISIRDKDFLHRYYEKVFQNLQQTNCRVLAKAYVKLVEPRKQVNYPYNGRKIVAGRTQQLEPDETKPPWWPSGVSHREPDHLPKAERIRLLVHILCELRTSHGVTARRLKEADQPIRRQISPTERLQILDEVYRVREEEEKFQEGVTDGKALVSISRANLPDAVEATLSQGSRSRRSSPTDEASTHGTEAGEEPMVVHNGTVQDTIVSQSIFAPADIPSDLSPTALRPPSHSPSQFIHQDLPIHPNYDPRPSSSSMSQQDLKRKRLRVESDPSTTTTPHTLAYYPPTFVGSQPYLPEAYNELHPFPAQVIPTTAPPGAEQYEGHMDSSYAFPYYFDN